MAILATPLYVTVGSYLLVGFLVSIVSFIVAGALYMNPIVAKIYESFRKSDGFKSWTNKKEYIGKMYLFGMLIPSILFTVVYQYIKEVLPGGIIPNALVFGVILVAVRIIPRWADMFMQTTYPNKLLKIELLNGTIISFVMAFVLALIG
jgi:H+/gluconate symporter-like permease